MNTQHNPISQKLEEMYEVWNQSVNDGTKLVRWVMPKDDSKMYEIFCHTECSAHGFLDDITIALTSPFNSKDSFSSSLVNELITNFEAQQKELKKHGFDNEWPEAVEFKEDANTSVIRKSILQEALMSFRNAMRFEEDRWLNIALLPQMVFNGIQYTNWLIEFLSEVPCKCRVIVIDYMESQHLKRVGLEHPAICTNLPLRPNMHQAMREIATSGGEGDPEVAFRNCLFKMGDGVKDKKLAMVEEWGEKAIEIATSMGQKSFQGTAYLTFAGMLLSFKGNERKAGEKLDKGLNVVMPGADDGDDTCKHLVVQLMATQSACCIHDGDKQGAIDWCIKQGDYALKEELFLSAMGAYRLASIYATNRNKYDKDRCTIKAYEAGMKLTDEEKKFSEFRFVALECFELYQYTGLKDKSKDVDNVMVELFGTDWEEQVKNQTNMAKKTSDKVYT